MSFIKRLYTQIKQGIQGLNIGITMGLPKLETVMDGVQKQTYTVVAGSTGSGKTTFALYAYIYKPLMAMLGNPKFKIIYYSLEMTAEILLAKLLSLYIFETYGKELTFKQIMSRQEILSDEMYAIVQECEPWLEKVMEHLTIYDKNLSAAALYAHLKQYADANGEFVPNGDNSTIYVPKVEGETVVVILDHIALLRKQQGNTKKDEIDLASKYLLQFRNKCSYSPVVLMQLNRGHSSMDRRNGGMQEIQLDDLKDSGEPSQDAEVVLAIFHPWREKMATYRDYNIKELQDKFRAIQVLKSRYGESDKSVGINFHGSIGYWKELPKGADIAASDYEQYKHLILDLDKGTVRDERETVKEETPYLFTL